MMLDVVMLLYWVLMDHDKGKYLLWSLRCHLMMAEGI